MFTVISLYTVKAYNSFHIFQFMITLCENQALVGGGGGRGRGILPLMAHTGRLQVKGVLSSGFRLRVHVYKSVRFYKNVYPKSLYYYCMFSHSSQGNSMVRIISWKRPSLVTMLLLKQRELIRQETLCSGNSIVFIPNCLVASFSEAHPYPKPSLPLLRVFLKLCFCKVLQTHYFVVKHESL